MPLYDVLAIVKATMPQAQVSMILKKATTAVLENGGVLTGIKSFGVNELAYTIRKYGELHDEVRPGVLSIGVRIARSRSTRAGLLPCRQLRLNLPFNSQGHYVQLSFFSSPATLPILEHNFRTDERLLRHVIVKKQAMPNLPKPKTLRLIQEDMCATRICKFRHLLAVLCEHQRLYRSCRRLFLT